MKNSNNVKRCLNDFGNSVIFFEYKDKVSISNESVVSDLSNVSFSSSFMPIP